MVPVVTAILALMLPVSGSGDTERLVRYAVEESVRGRLQLPPDDIVIEFRSIPIVPWIEGMAVRVDVGHTPRLIGNISLPMEVEANGVVVRRSVISVKVRVFGERLVAQRSLKRHDELSESDMEMRRMEITGLPEDGVESIAEVQNTRATRMIREGSVITASALEPVPLVRANSRVTIIARIGNVTVSLRGIAKEDGCKGERILVEKVDSRGRFKVEVVGTSTVAYMVE